RKAHAEARERVGAALLPVDDADGVADDEALRADRRHRLRECAARGDDVLEKAHQLAVLEGALDPFGRAVFLGLTADDDEGQPVRQRCRSCQRDRPERRPGEPDGVGLALANGAGERRAELAQDRRFRLEPVLVEVPRRAAPGAEDEVALQQRPLDDEPAELLRRHPGAERAREASRSNPAEPGSRTTAEPSAYETPTRSSGPDAPKKVRHAQIARATRIASRISFLTPAPPSASSPGASSAPPPRSTGHTSSSRRRRVPRSAGDRWL